MNQTPSCYEATVLAKGLANDIIAGVCVAVKPTNLP